MPKSMSMKTYLQIKACSTLLAQARNLFLKTGEVRADKLVAYMWPVDELYRTQLAESKSLSLKVHDLTVKKIRRDIATKVLPKALKNWLDEVTYIILLNKSFDKLLATIDAKTHVPAQIADSMSSLYKTLCERIDDIELHNGHAGCGKSSCIAKIVNQNKDKKSIVVSLSNTIGCMFKDKAPSVMPFSCTACQFYFSQKRLMKYQALISNCDIVVIDEFSQWGYEWAELLDELLIANPRAKFYIMGDIDQIPTFLGSGSLQYSFMTDPRLKHKVIQHDIQYRFMNNPTYLKFIESVQNKKVENCPFIVKDLASLDWKNIDVCITGANETVDSLNCCMMATRFGKDAVVADKRTVERNGAVKETYRVILSKTLHNCNDVELICSDTNIIDNYKTKRNEQFLFKYMSGDKYVLESKLTGANILVNEKTLDYKFEPGYAITVNRSQGLEWDNVCVFMTPIDKNLKNFNAMYVAISRGKNTLYYLDCGKSEKDNVIVDMNNILNITYKFFNNFAETN